jgi:alpha-1,6-mannosyltransferase
VTEAASAATSARFDEARLLAQQAPPIDLARTALPPPLRPAAGLGVLDISEYFAETSGGVRTYLLQKARYVEAHPELRQVLVLPGAEDGVGELTGVRCYRLHGPLIPLQRTYRFMLATRSLARICAHERPDLIEVGSAYTVPWLVGRATASLRVPAVWFYHSHLPPLLNPHGARGLAPARLAELAVAAYVRRVARTVSATIASTDFVQTELEGLGIRNVVKVPLGVDVERFHPSRSARRLAVRAARGLPDGPLALFVGRFAREKHMDVIMRAWQEIGPKTGATLVLVGTGPYEARLRQMAGSGVVFLPFERHRDALADLYAAADFAITPGPMETFGLSALEAMASGIPVLAPDRGGVAESVGRSGAGRRFVAGSVDSVIAETCALLEADQQALGRIGRAYVERHHCWEQVFARLFEVYRGILGR